MRVFLAISVIVLAAIVEPFSARAADGGPPGLLAAGEIVGAPGGYNHVLLLWDERLDQRVVPAPGDFKVWIDGVAKTPIRASYVLSGLGGPDGASFFTDPSGTTVMRLDLPASVMVDSANAITVDYTVGAAPLRDLSLTEAPSFTGFSATVFVGLDPGFFNAVVDEDHGANRVSLVFRTQIDLTSLPPAADFTIMVNGVKATISAVAGFQPDDPADRLGLGVLDLELTTFVRRGDSVTVAYNEDPAPLANKLRQRNGGPLYGSIAQTPVLLFLGAHVAATAGTSPVTTAVGPPTSFDPVTTTLTRSIAVTATIDVMSVGASPTGYAFFGKQVVITTSATAPATNPFVLRFEIDSTLVPAGETKDSLVILRDGVPLATCSGAVGEASPAPACVSARELLVGGDIAITVLTTSASTWNIATVKRYVFRGFLWPVNNPPVVNVAQAGTSVPVRFSLTGDRGLAIFAGGSPASQRIQCDRHVPLDPIERTVRRDTASLVYNPRTDVYIYTWPTASAWAGTCRRFMITFGDGSAVEALFRFTR